MPSVDSLLSERQPYRSKRVLSHVRECCELCCLTVAIFLIVGLFAIPVSLRHFEIDDLTLSTPVPATESPPSSDNSCPQQSINNTACPSYYSWGRVNQSVCTGVSYIGSACKQNLNIWQQCSLGQAGNVRVNDTGDLITEAERNATTITNVLNLVGSEGCLMTGLPFICQYLFPLCDCNTGDVLLPSKEYCIRISSNDCQMEWALAKQFGYGDLLPDCNALPTTANGTTPSGNSNFSNVSNSTAGPCRESFLRINGTCQPICHLWEQTSRPWSIVLKSVNIISLSVGLISGIVVIVLSVIQYKEKLRFPSISLVYFTIGVCIIAIAGLVGEAATEYFYCSSLSLITSVDNPTVYCTVAGGILQFFLVNLSLWWLVHVYLLFHMVMWPSHRNMIERRHKWIHALVFIIVTILSLPGVLLVVLHQDYRYTFFNFPPLFCAPDDEVFFYSTTMVLDIVVAIGIIFLILALCLIHKNQGLLRTNKGNIVVRTSEKWQLLVLIYNAIFIVIVTVFTSLAGSSVSRRFVRAITSHFTCEALEYTPGKCDRAVFEQYSTGWVFTVILVLLALIPVVSLVQAWDTDVMKHKCRSRKRLP